MFFKDIGEVMLFPFSEDMLNIIKFRDALEFNIVSVVSFKSWGYVGRDAATIDGGIASGHIVNSDFETELDKIDTVILGSFRKYYGDEHIVEKYLDEMLEAGKNVILLEDTFHINFKQYEEKFYEINRKLYYFAPNALDTLLLSQITIPVPVIGVFGLEENCGKTEMQLLIARALKKEGYKTSMIGPNTQIGLFGGNVYPKLLYRDDIGEIEKIKSIRSFANKIVENEKPDILIISSPYGINSFGDDEVDYKYNGMLAHIIIEALHPDANIFCINSGRDIRWSKRSIETLELLSCAPTIAVATKRINNRPEITSLKLNTKLKKGLHSDNIFSQLKQTWNESTGKKVLDQDYLQDGEIVELIENTFDTNNQLAKLI